jgi:DNA polymerase III delta prime subunit
MPPAIRVITPSDLQPERRALMDALNRMEEMRFVGMEFFGNRPDDTHDASIDQVDLCEVFVGIIGHRYGSGITEAEYRRAREHGLPCFVYFKREATSRPELTDGDPALAAKLATFKRDLLRGHTVKEFTSPEELAANATADLHNWVAARWISLEREAPADSRAPITPPDADRTNLLRLLERIRHDWVEGVLEASLHLRARLELGVDWREDAVEHPWDRIVVAPNRPIQTLGDAEDSIAGVFAAAQNTLLVLGEPGAGKTTTLLELAREPRGSRAPRIPPEPAPVVLALSTWTGRAARFRRLAGRRARRLRYQVPKRLARRGSTNGPARAAARWARRSARRPAGGSCVECDQCVRAGAPAAGPRRHLPRGGIRRAARQAAAARRDLPAAADAGADRALFRGGGRRARTPCAARDARRRRSARVRATPLMLSVMTVAWRDAPAGGCRRRERRRPRLRNGGGSCLKPTCGRH